MEVHKLSVFEDSGFSLMARILGSNAAYIQQADLADISYVVFDLRDTSSSVASGSLSVSSVVFDALQTDSRWTVDSTGYNFRWDVPASLLAQGDRTYRVEVKFTPNSGEPFHVVVQVTTTAVYGS